MKKQIIVIVAILIIISCTTVKEESKEKVTLFNNILDTMEDYDLAGKKISVGINISRENQYLRSRSFNYFKDKFSQNDITIINIDLIDNPSIEYNQESFDKIMIDNEIDYNFIISLSNATIEQKYISLIWEILLYDWKNRKEIYVSYAKQIDDGTYDSDETVFLGIKECIDAFYKMNTDRM